MLADLSHFSMVGFPLETTNASAFAESLEPLTEICAMEALGPGDVLCIVRDPSGGELLIALEKSGSTLSLMTANPAFDGEGRVEVVVDEEVSDPEWEKYERAYAVRFSGEETPFVFELTDPRQKTFMAPGAKVTVEIAAFSFDLSAYQDSAAYYAGQEKDEIRFSDKFFIPSGMFDVEKGDMSAAERPEAIAMFAGEVLKAELRSNVAGGGKFWWALVETYEGATFDVVIDPAQLSSPLEPGNVVSGSFWLTARVVSPGRPAPPPRP